MISKQAASFVARQLLLALFLAVIPRAVAQDASGRTQNPTQVFHLANAAQESEANEILVAIRNVIAPTDKLFFLSSSYDIVASGPPDQLALIGKLVGELDRPKQLYRLVYTITESDGGKRIGVQHFAMIVVTGQRVTLKQGDKIPIATAPAMNMSNLPQPTQFTYVDVGMNLDATLDRYANGLRLRSKVEQSGAATSEGGSIPTEPVIRQTVLEGTSVITPGKPQILGSIDIVGSTRHVDFEVVAEPMP